MPLRAAQLPRTLSSAWEMITQLQRDIRELRSARTLENATIGGGQGLIVQNGSTGPSVKVVPEAQGIGFITQQQAAALISTGDPTEIAPGIFTAYLDTSGASPTPAMFMLCPDTNTGTSYTLMQGGSPAGDSPVWQAQAGASSLSFNYDALVISIAAGGNVTLDGSGLYFTGEGWQPLPLTNGWTAYGGTFQAPIFMKKIDGMVQMAGTIAPGTTTNGTQVATLPTGYTPVADHMFRVSAGASASADVYIRNTGADQIQNTSGTVQWLSLSQIRFPAGQSYSNGYGNGTYGGGPYGG